MRSSRQYRDLQWQDPWMKHTAQLEKYCVSEVVTAAPFEDVPFDAVELLFSLSLIWTGEILEWTMVVEPDAGRGREEPKPPLPAARRCNRCRVVSCCCDSKGAARVNEVSTRAPTIATENFMVVGLEGCPV